MRQVGTLLLHLHQVILPLTQVRQVQDFTLGPMALRDPLQLPQDEPGCRVRWPQLCCVCVRFVRGCCRCVRNRNSDAARGDGLADTGIGRRREASGARRRGGTVPALGQASAVEPVPRE